MTAGDIPAARRRLLRAAAVLPLAGGVPRAAAMAGRTWPARGIRVVVVYPPGGVSDTIARLLAEALSRDLGVPAWVENKGGAGGSVGMETVARAAPDGYTLAFSALTPLTLNPLLSRPSGEYDPLREIAPVAAVMRTPVLVAGTPAFTGRDFADLVDEARRHPGAIRWASSGVATTGHMVMAQVAAASGARITHIPYHGGGPQLNDALGGRFEVLSTNVAALQLDYVRTGRLKALAVGAPARLGALPDAPTLEELGYPQANLMSLFGLFAPAGTPRPVQESINAAVHRALVGGQLAERLESAYNLPAAGSVADFRVAVRDDYEANRRLVKAGALRSDRTPAAP
ncbi:MAG: tripartite tricarboxylate transporter substrate binding protein [Alcaligenaceae bacterium]|nr:tripartite tricarboxylate transporter substrate binding protein [Alcaligenaceae bacterium SAGV5]MPS55390.1 tripartite tricarboxylate transporter substrate binding protein [Alcaligenaceae bacterium SAGV3]MPT56659.1 tripartite tricarboxylate transporter substrate binding protein [Alcaligenaceae bacterium]